MEKDFQSKYLNLEERHWWFRSRREVIGDMIKNKPINSKILDIGCSGGVMIDFLHSNGFSDISGVDISEDAILKCKKKGLQNTSVSDAQALPFADNTFDIAIASDVLEHINDDGKALNEWKRILKINGILIIFVPAYQILWSSHDEANNHFRRYSQEQLLELAEKSGLIVRRSSYWNFSLFPLVLLIRSASRLIGTLIHKKQNDHLNQTNSVINSLLYWLVSLENRILSLGFNFPFGVSVFCVLKKEEN